MFVALGIFLALIAALLYVNLATGERRVSHEIEHQYPVDDPQFFRAMGMLLGPGIVEGNRVQALHNGDEIFPAMLEAIRGARSTILFETFIYWSGKIGDEFAQALSERARAGLKVHVLLDWLGSIKVEERLVEAMKAAGVEVYRFHPLRWYNLGRINNRTHRKLLIVDGSIGFTGGVGIAPPWTGHAQDEEHWRDSHYRVEGPVVAQMQGVMLANWSKASGRILHGGAYFPPLQPVGEQQAQMFHSSPSGGSESMQLMVLIAITAAVKTIDIASAYFVPDDMARLALVAALRRGVRVRVITPGRHIDTQTVRHASRALWGELLEAGLEMHVYQPTMYHCKTIIVDGLLVSVGSTNFDPRSFHLNDEANLNVYDAKFAAQLTRVFENDLRRCKPFTLEQWRSRPLLEKVRERVTSWLAPVL
ncbi:phospholipase D-like domain-containing protein [Ramlibacter alkalitolerans]|uniref:Cardiolipin synthase B n=1 Tax=Ramlibacter alkalitolerans TaxID=2039631 RepID=A0ABS1JWS4_9BURK|nr:phospholipase D-like domain-containing protein [Ramlibacter alkalitolerans]MBL0428647.1 cardiolipin synthase B [Ramlibacter alkalitolerans]